MLHFATVIINYLVAHWPAISALVGGGAGLSVILQYVIHKLHIDSKKLAYTLIHLLSIGAAASAFYLDNVNAVGAYAGLVIAAQTVHRFIVSPYYSKYILPYLTFLSESAPQPTTQYELPAAPVSAEPAFVS
jgi:spore maturation protein SpmB